jgi:hypothetical protein
LWLLPREQSRHSEPIEPRATASIGIDAVNSDIAELRIELDWERLHTDAKEKPRTTDCGFALLERSWLKTYFERVLDVDFGTRRFSFRIRIFLSL